MASTRLRGVISALRLALFDELGLRAQLSASRGQGLIALNDAVLDAAHQAQA